MLGFLMFSRESKGKIRRKRINSLYSFLVICRLVGIPNINQLNASVALIQEGVNWFTEQIWRRTDAVEITVTKTRTLINNNNSDDTQAVVQMCSVKKLFLKTSQNSQEKICARISFLIRLQATGSQVCKFIKNWLWHKCFSVNFAKFLRAPFFTEHL